MRKLFIATFMALVAITNAQDFKKNSFTIQREAVVDPKEAKPDFNAGIKRIEMPHPDGDSYKDFIASQKIKSRAQYPLKNNSSANKTLEKANKPIVGRQKAVYRVYPNGSVNIIGGGIPNDNSMAISNDGVMIAGFNRAIWAWDYKTDTTLFPLQLLGLKQIVGDNSVSNYYYDPKLIYDPVADRFILVFLKNNNPATNRIFVCFSSSNDPTDPWHVYSLPGNPLNNNRWTDYPAISITDNDLFITGNLIVPGVSWQVGFDGSVIWQVKKEDGYNNATQLSTTLYSQIKHEGKYTRNIHPIRGAHGIAETQYFMSNRNFDVTNDTVFVMEMIGEQGDPNSQLIVNYGITDVAYGMPPNGQQEDTDLDDPTSGL
ncbi:MAG: hypothetical protein N4A46_06290, partial [Schleiferiaceae bacterium]|nr:hypothetical protein [Schleiferiaceae bacterium]